MRIRWKMTGKRQTRPNFGKYWEYLLVRISVNYISIILHCVSILIRLTDNLPISCLKIYDSEDEISNSWQFVGLLGQD